MKTATRIVGLASGVLIASAASAAPVYNWTGGYVGLQGGYSWGEAGQTYDTPTGYSINTLHPKGWGGGLEAGANYQFASGLVIGIEGDVTFAHVTDTVVDNLGTAILTSPQTNTATIDVAGNIRGRLGFAFDRTLLFAAGGVAALHNRLDVTAGDLHEQATIWGWTVGAGFEQAVTDKVSVKLEYLYSEHASHTWFAGAPYAASGSDTGGTVRAGVNLHF